MTRISAKEAYSNRDLIAQIARLKTYVEQGTFKEVSTSYSGGVLTLTFTAYDDSTQSFNIPMDSIVGVTGDQVGNTVTIHVEFASGTVVDIPYTVSGDTSATPDTLALRDANGRMESADPASGDTSQKVVTTNWVSQTGSGRPNNLIHDGGTEDIHGLKTMFGGLDDINQHAALYLDAEITNLTDTSSKLSKLSFVCRDGSTVAYIRFNNRISAGVRGVQLVIFKGDGTPTSINLGTVTI